MKAVRVVSVVAAVGIVLVSVEPAQAAHRSGHGSARSARGSIHGGSIHGGSIHGGSIHGGAPRIEARAPHMARGYAQAYPRGYSGLPGPNLLAPLTGLATLASGLARPVLALAAAPALAVGAVVGTITAGVSYAMGVPPAGPYWGSAPIPYQTAAYPAPAYAPAPYVVGSVYAGAPRLYAAPRLAVPFRR
jgi:hypothetical protein